MNKRVINIISLITVFLMMASAAITRSGSLFGHKIELSGPGGDSAITTSPDGTVTINTTTLGEKIIGYSGQVPVEISITDGKIESVKPLDNEETPGFFKRVTSSGLLDTWVGKTPQQAVEMEVDGVTGATYSSKALIANVQAGLNHYMKSDVGARPKADTPAAGHKGWQFYCTIAVLLSAAIIPLYTKNKHYRVAQQLLNAGILGFWSGTFVDYTMMLGIMANGTVAISSIIPLVMLTIAFIYPMFGKDGYYCAWVCPLGSMQELALRCNPRHRLHISPALVKKLTWFRKSLWAALMLCLWTGAWFSWIDYELFTSFMVEEAATGVLIAGALMLLISIFIPRPYCRFICPTGTLLHMSQNTNS